MQRAFPNVGMSGNAFLAPGSNRRLRYLQRNGKERHRLREKSVKDRNILDQLYFVVTRLLLSVARVHPLLTPQGSEPPHVAPDGGVDETTELRGGALGVFLCPLTTRSAIVCAGTQKRAP
jgi:hypothetical protein